MNRIDYSKVFREHYSATSDPALVHVAPMQFLVFDGQGEPDGSVRFQEGVEALFAVAHTLKLMLKRGPMALDFAIMPLELLRGCDHTHSTGEQWRLMVMQPPVVSMTLVEEAVATTGAKKPIKGLTEVRLERFDEGKAVQVLHTGLLAEREAAMEQLRRFAAAQGWRLAGRHHEIYLGDFRRGAPEQRKTILRHPVEQPA